MSERKRDLRNVLAVVLAIAGVLSTQPVAAGAPSREIADEQRTVYVVSEKDTLYGIARRFGADPEEIAIANDLDDPSLIFPGEELIIPSAIEQQVPTYDVMASAAIDESAVSVVEDSVPSSGAGAPPPLAMTLKEIALLDGLNSRRAAAGVDALTFDPTLLPLARGRSDDMAGRNYFSHTSPEGATLHDKVEAAGIAYAVVNEILARTNYPDDQAVEITVAAFMKSDAHRAHALHPIYSRIAAGEQQSVDGMKYFTVVLASER